MSSVKVGLLILVLGTSMGTKEKSKVTRKKPIAVTDPQNMRTLEEWINLEREILEKSCKVVKLPSDGTLTEMARSLMQFYRQLNTQGHPDTQGTSMGTQLRTRLTGLGSGMPAVFSDPITFGEIGTISQQRPTTTNRHIPPVDRQLDLGGDLTALFNQRDPLNLDIERIGKLQRQGISHTQPYLYRHHSNQLQSYRLYLLPMAKKQRKTPTIHTTHDPTTAQHTLPTGVEDNRPVTLRDIRDIMTHSMREFQHSIQQMVTQQIETQIQSTIPIPSLPPSSSQLYNNQNTGPLPTQP